MGATPACGPKSHGPGRCPWAIWSRSTRRRAIIAMEVALGLKARTGRAVIVVVGGSARDPRYVERSEFRLLPDGALAPYHAAAELEPSAARSSVERSIAAADRL